MVLVSIHYLALIGGLLDYLYDQKNTPLSKLVAFQIGLSAPLILKALASAVPRQTQQVTPRA